MNRHDRRAIQAKARKTQQGLNQLGVAAQKLKGLEALPDALKDVQAILDSVNEMRTAVACTIQDLNKFEHRMGRLESAVQALAQKTDNAQLVAQAMADYNAAHLQPEGEAAPVEPASET